MKLTKKGAHARKHIPYKRGKHAQGGTTVISTNIFKYTLQTNQSKLISGKVIDFSLATEQPDLIAGIPYKKKEDPEKSEVLYNILKGGIE